MTLTVDEHPLLDLRVFVTEFVNPIGKTKTPKQILNWISREKQAPVVADVPVKPAVRDLLRYGGYKPTGRGKPASEYLRQALEKGSLGTINLPVDACNVVSLHSGLPISVVDLDQVQDPLRISIAPEGSEYQFNASGQSIKLDGLLCLFDAIGPCANGVKDSQRTKTSATSVKTMSIIWGTKQLPGHSEQTEQWYRQLLESANAKTSDVVQK